LISREHRRVTGLARPDQHDQRVAVAVDKLVDLRRQPAAGTTQGVVSGLRKLDTKEDTGSKS